MMGAMSGRAVDGPHEVEVWTCTPVLHATGRIAGTILGVVAAVLVFVGVFADGGWPFLVGAAVAAGLALLAWRLLVRPRVVLDDLGVTVVNPWSTTTMAWADISHADAAYSGLELTSRTGDVVTAWVAQKSHYSETTHRTTPADELARIVQRRLQTEEPPAHAYYAPPVHKPARPTFAIVVVCAVVAVTLAARFSRLGGSPSSETAPSASTSPSAMWTEYRLGRDGITITVYVTAVVSADGSECHTPTGVAVDRERTDAVVLRIESETSPAPTDGTGCPTGEGSFEVTLTSPLDGRQVEIQS